MSKQREEILLGVKISMQLKESITQYCHENGVKLKYFIAQAIQDKLEKVAADKHDNVVIDQRLKDPEFSKMSDLKQYIKNRKQK